MIENVETRILEEKLFLNLIFHKDTNSTSTSNMKLHLHIHGTSPKSL